jgi:predicted alpha/beta-fold hydrolase
MFCSKFEEGDEDACDKEFHDAKLLTIRKGENIDYNYDDDNNDEEKKEDVVILRNQDDDNNNCSNNESLSTEEQQSGGFLTLWLNNIQNDIKREGVGNKKLLVSGSIIGSLTCFLMSELSLQKKLTCHPHVYSQFYDPNDKNCNIPSMMNRKICPSLWIGTRPSLASTAAYALPHLHHEQPHHIAIKERINSLPMGGNCVLDWYLPSFYYRLSRSTTSASGCNDNVRNYIKSNITTPVVLILHGINNDGSFTYMKRLAYIITDQLQWIAVCMNFRGCDESLMNSPRGYNASYTGDLHTIVQILTHRMTIHISPIDTTINSNSLRKEKVTTETAPLFLVGHSLGANVVCKYLGEQGAMKASSKNEFGIKSNILGAVSLANPMRIHSEHVDFPYNILIGLGIKRYILKHYNAFRHMGGDFQKKLRQALFHTLTIGQVDQHLSYHLLRNITTHDYDKDNNITDSYSITTVGYPDGAEEYWNDASSVRYMADIQVPTLLLVSQDDHLIRRSLLQNLRFSFESNPNITVAQTRCGGHLGWQESVPHNKYQAWSDIAVAEYFQHLYLRHHQQTQNNLSIPINKSNLNSSHTVARSPSIKSKL